MCVPAVGPFHCARTARLTCAACVSARGLCLDKSISFFPAILTLFLINVLMFEEHTAKSVYHGFVMACYFTPVLGAMLADSYLGKFR